MKNFKIIIFLFFAIQLFAISCNHVKPEAKKNKNISDSIGIQEINNKKDSLKKIDNVVNQNSIKPYKQVDSIVKLIERKFNNLQIAKLDSICNKSDGDLSEYLDEVSLKLFSNNLNEFTGFLLNNPNSCLKFKLIEGIGSNFSVYEKSQRFMRLYQERDSVIIKAKKESLTDEQVLFIKEIYKKANPNLLD